MPQANLSPLREEIVTEIARIFPDEDVATILAVLDEYGCESYERERERVQRAILMLADGDVDKLLSYTLAAKHDYRDVLWWAEYPPEKVRFPQS